jgi:CRP-like cAMP-binding protein
MYSAEIRNLFVFRKLSEEHAGLLAPLAESYTWNAGSIIIQQGATAEYIHIILHGRVEISYKPYDGNTITVTHVDAGGVFGWSAVTGSRLYSSTAIAIEGTECIRMRGDRIRTLCREHPGAGTEILNCLADAVGSRWKDAHDQVRSILTHGMKGM